jgi:NTP pyrophosphatase (non-canonical NTP hydrolase)
MNQLTFAQLRKANAARLPQFKNSFNEPAHKKPDGSDWSPRMWLIALMGELGELVEAKEPRDKADEAADVAIYLDLYTQRALDRNADFDLGIDDDRSHEGLLFGCIARLGRLCEAHKKYKRGDITEPEYTHRYSQVLLDLIHALTSMHSTRALADWRYVQADHEGIDLSNAICDKFNRTSHKVGSEVFIGGQGA